MSETPAWALALAYWFHMLATVTWLGGLSALALFILPAAQAALEPAGFARLLEKIQRRLDALGWLCLAVLAGSGLLQMSANPNYRGFLAISNRWAVAILAKHILFGMMVLLSAAQTWGVLPGLRRASLLQAKGLGAPQAERLQRKNVLLLRLNLILAVLVLALTSLARTS